MLNVKVIVSVFNQEKALVGSFSVVREYEIFANIRLKFYIPTRLLSSLLQGAGLGSVGSRLDIRNRHFS